MVTLNSEPQKQTSNQITCAAEHIFLHLSSVCAEKGQFLALDLGGSKFKVLQVKVREGMGIRKGGVEMEEKTYPIPKELLSGKGAEVSRRKG